MSEQLRTKGVSGRPESLTGFQKNRLRTRFRKWLDKEATKLGVSHMTLRRALANEKRAKEDAA